MSQKIIAWDLGTGGNKASLYEVDGQCLAATFVPYPTHYPRHGWHEQKPEVGGMPSSRVPGSC